SIHKNLEFLLDATNEVPSQFCLAAIPRCLVESGNHMHELDVRLIIAPHPPCPPNQRHGVVVAVNGAEYITNFSGSWPRSFSVCRGPYRADRIVQDLASNRARQESAKRAIAMRGYHDEVDLVTACVIDNHLSRVALFDHAFYVERRKVPRHKAFHRAHGHRQNFLSQSRIETPWVCDFGKKRDARRVQHCQFSSKVLSYSFDIRYGSWAWFGKIDWEQDMFHTGHWGIPSGSPSARRRHTSSKAVVAARITGPITIPASPKAIKPPRIDRRIPRVWI